MIASLRAEYRKLLTVRSTYLITGIVLVFAAVFSYFVLGRQDLTGAKTNPDFLYGAIKTMLNLFTILSGIVAILLVTHEYRYSMIMHTLTASRSRMQVFAAKLIVALSYALVASLLLAIVTYVSTRLGVASKDVSIIAQTTPLWTAIWRLSGVVFAYTLTGLALGFLMRNVVGATVVYMFASPVQQLMVLFMHDNVKYLPYNVFDQISAINNSFTFGGQPLTNLTALGFAALYTGVLMLISAVLFVRRDAN
jgi:ABC-type transport system involved in multi-copper enzyme maturation permease subunit